MASAGAGGTVLVYLEFRNVTDYETNSLARNPLRIVLAEYDPHREALTPASFRFKSGAECWENRARLLLRRSASLRCRWVWKSPRVDNRAARCSAPAPGKTCGPVLPPRWTIDKFLPGR